MKKCELCNSIARMYCDSDKASLCWECDTKVHTANFLFAKHSRTLLCHACQSLTPWTASGPRLGPTVTVCQACANGNVRRNNSDGDHDPEEEIEDYEDDENEDDEDEDEDEDDENEGVDEDDGENQVVPLSSSTSLPPPLVSSSSGSERSSLYSSRNGRNKSEIGFSSK